MPMLQSKNRGGVPNCGAFNLASHLLVLMEMKFELEKKDTAHMGLKSTNFVLVAPRSNQLG